jgi:hypothetical protein
MQDRVFAGGPHVDADYAARRRDVFVVAVNCAEAGGTCFCASMGIWGLTRFDLALTELIDAGATDSWPRSGARRGGCARTAGDAPAPEDRRGRHRGTDGPPIDVPDHGRTGSSCIATSATPLGRRGRRCLGAPIQSSCARPACLTIET